MQRDDFVEIGKQTVARLIENPPPPSRVGDFSIRTTSGTTEGEPLMVAHDTSDGSEDRPGWYEGAERILVCQGGWCMRVSQTLFLRRSKSPIMRSLCLDRTDLTPEVGALIAEYAPDRIIAFPSFALAVADVLDERTRRGITFIGANGELLTPPLLQALKVAYPNAFVPSIYITNETGSISQLCVHVPPNHHHPRTGVTVEVLDPDEEGVGELAVTLMLAQAFPIRRYKTGDMARFRTMQCPCGKATTFEILGRRGYDFIKLAGALLQRKEFDRVAALFPDLIEDYRAEASSVFSGAVQRGCITLRVRSPGGPGTQELARELAGKFSKELFVTRRQTLANLVAKGIFLPLRVEFTAEPFPEKSKSVKLTHRL